MKNSYSKKRKQVKYHLCGLTAYCTKFRYILLEWQGLLLKKSKASIK